MLLLAVLSVGIKVLLWRWGAVANGCKFSAILAWVELRLAAGRYRGNTNEGF